MARLFGEGLSREELLRRVSSMRQVCGIRLFRFEEGKAAGVKAADINTGGGLNFTVLLDRGMDLGAAYYKGIPISWQSKVGVIGPTYFENQDHEWLRDFYGGMLTTCGLIQVGEPCEYKGAFYGLHGRISHTPAENVNVTEDWEGEDYVMRISGKMREAKIYDENMTLTREVKCAYGENKIRITDTVVNESYQESPFMIMYHVNVPFPIVGKNTHYLTSAEHVQVLNVHEQEGSGDYSTATDPVKGFIFETFAHDQNMERKYAYNAIINDKMNLGVYLRYDPRILPIGNQWKMLGEQDYVMAMEPANTYPVGIAPAEKEGFLKTLGPREKCVIELEIGVLDGAEDIENFKALL